MNRQVLLTGAVLLLLAIVSTSARPEGTPESLPSSTAQPGTTSTPAPGESKVSKFFDDVSEAFKQGTAKVKESFESAATSVKDGVLRGYGFVKDKLTGAGDATTPSSNVSSSTTESSVVARVSAVNSESKPAPAGSLSAAAMTPVELEPNDDESRNEDRLIFVGDEETGTDTPPTTAKTNLDDRFIIDGPAACQKGQQVVNGKCRNTF